MHDMLMIALVGAVQAINLSHVPHMTTYLMTTVPSSQHRYCSFCGALW